ncbi:hypothetical protein [Bradyrhizobium diazoefficiens]|uniref:hypothetical protein n=1 Tax=Bradyrhizobium diazoefficiens TaxID=1355477 RepID=UPI001B45C560|nr:hypothetical protein [Bradyrhizobium japonicum]
MASKLSSGTVVLLLVGATVLLIASRPPVWMLLLLGSFALAALYIVVRTKSRYDPLDPRFGSCIPPISKPKASAGNVPKQHSDVWHPSDADPPPRPTFGHTGFNVAFGE